ncbi:hypothetical protein C808_00052 [Lachnospiraceae bacterium M18-1]|nr:hypothetical protein C808_00052 [Lachnospiraceae bacterium M18-1]
MYAKRVRITKCNVDRIRKSLNCDFVSLTLTLERENIKKYVPRVTK